MAEPGFSEAFLEETIARLCRPDPGLRCTLTESVFTRHIIAPTASATAPRSKAANKRRRSLVPVSAAFSEGPASPPRSPAPPQESGFPEDGSGSALPLEYLSNRRQVFTNCFMPLQLGGTAGSPVMEPAEFAVARFRAYQKAFGAINDVERAVELEMYDGVFQKVADWVAACARSMDPLLRTGLLYAGGNVADHKSMLSALERHLRQVDSSPLRIARLSAESCPSVPAAMRRMLEQLCGSVARCQSLRAQNMKAFARWARDHKDVLDPSEEDSSSAPPIATQRPAATGPVVHVVIVDDYEAVDADILEHLMLVCHAAQTSDNLCIVFLMCTSTAWKLTSSRLQSHIRELLLPELFVLRPSVEHLWLLFSRLFVQGDSTIEFRLDSRSLEFLFDSFFFTSLSVSGFFEMVRAACADLYLTNPLSYLPALEAPPPTAAHITWAREHLLSLKAADKLSPALLLDHCRDLKRKSAAFGTAFRVIEVLLQQLQSLKVDMQRPWNMYQLLISGEEATRLLEWLPKALQQCSELQRPAISLVQLAALLEAWSVELARGRLVRHLAALNRVQRDLHELDERVETDKKRMADLIAEAQRQELSTVKRQKLQLQAAQAGGFRPHPIRQRIWQFLHDFLEETLPALELCPAAELIYAHAAPFLRAHFNVSQAARLHLDLMNPPVPEGGPASGKKSRQTMPDFCRLYHLVRACGKQVNLEDLRRSFLSVLPPSEQKSDSRLLDARFLGALATLQQMGYLEASSTRPDHAIRLDRY